MNRASGTGGTAKKFNVCLTGSWKKRKKVGRSEKVLKVLKEITVENVPN